MIHTGENRSTRRETSPSVTSSTKNLTQNDLRVKIILRFERPSTNRLRYDTALQDQDKSET
jgi:hypothetical protein